MVVDLVAPDQLDRLFHALADATRRDIVTRTLQQDQSVSALARLYPISLTAVQKHVTVLERAGLVTKHRTGREQHVRARAETLRRAATLLEQLEATWRQRITSIDHLLESP